MIRWDDLSPAELTALETVFWSSGISRAELAEQTGFSRSKSNTAAAALIERGMLDETGPQASSGGRRPETLLLSAGMGVLAAIDLGASSVDVARETSETFAFAAAGVRLGADLPIGDTLAVRFGADLLGTITPFVLDVDGQRVYDSSVVSGLASATLVKFF